jgi:hypothetical protein
MTGYPRPRRSYYLDDMDLKPGDKVQCKCSMGQPEWTPGAVYTVLPDGYLTDNTGSKVIPSARFTYL